MTVFGRRVGIGACVAVACFGALTVLRALDGNWGWAAVLAVATVSQAWLALSREPTRPPQERPADRRGGPARSGNGADPARQLRSWKVMTLSASALTVAVLWWSDPALAPIAALITVICLAGWLRAARRASLTTSRRHQ